MIGLAIGSCSFTKKLIERPAQSPTCEAREAGAVNVINTTKPALVIVLKRYRDLQVVRTTDPTSATCGVGPCDSRWISSARMPDRSCSFRRLRKELT